MTTFFPSLSERKRILKNKCRESKSWKPRVVLMVFLFLLAAGLIGITAAYFLIHPFPAETVITFFGLAFCVACIPFFIAISVKNTAKFKCGLPFSSFANGTLFLKEDRLEYVFWRVGRHEPAAYSSKRAVYRDDCKFSYVIKKKDILSVNVQDDVCCVKGSGIVREPDWADETGKGQFSCNQFKFILAFEEGDAGEIIKKWRS